MNNHFLVVIDMQNDFINGSLGSEDAQNIVPRVIKKILNHHGPIIATADTHDSDYDLTLEGKKLPVKHCIELSDGWEINKEVAAAMVTQGNYLGFVKKPTFGSFDVKQIVEEYIHACKMIGINNGNVNMANNPAPEFTIIGLDTDICVISNALILRAAFPDSKITIDSKCCAGTSRKAHAAALEVAKSCQIDIE